MRRAKVILIWAALLAVARTGTAIQTGRVELGVNGAYDGTVWIARDTSGSLTFRDQQLGTSVTLEQLVQGQNDHGGLSGLADDDHTQYLNGARHWQTHTAGYNDELPIPPDVGNNATLGGHISDGDIHVVKNSADTIAGTWRFTGTPVFAPALRIEPVAPDPNGSIEFGIGYGAPKFTYLGSLDEFEFTRPIRATSGSLTDLVGSRFRVYTNLDGRGLGGQPSATLTNFVSLAGIEAGNLLDRSVNEDIAGQWDFLAPVRVFDDLTFEDATASGVISAVGLMLTTQTETAETGHGFSRIETTSPVLTILLDKNGNYSANEYVAISHDLCVDGGDIGLTADPDLVQLSSGEVKIQTSKGSLIVKGVGGASTELESDNALELDSNSGSAIKFKHNDSEKARVQADGNFGIGDSSPASLLTVGNGDKFQVDSSGNVTMDSSAKIAHGDDGTSAPFIVSHHAPDAIVESLSSNEELGSGAVAQVGGAAQWHFRFCVPSRVNGGKVVLDRMYISLADADAGDYVDLVRLYRVTSDATAIIEFENTTNRTSAGTYQCLSSAVTLADDCSYWFYVQGAHSDDNDLDLTHIIVHYHTE
ncbi:hypothetical protein AMJ85_04660 [candidate division BRC1 bacterium SM23_51]|nr:MAG: hypothetical protein AMJ85_04660 [candidate division BRC1 bacterium SM23_51]